MMQVLKSHQSQEVPSVDSPIIDRCCRDPDSHCSAMALSLAEATSSRCHRRHSGGPDRGHPLPCSHEDHQLKWVLHSDRGVRITIMLDETSHTGRWSVLTAAVYDHGRAIPLAWMLWRGQTIRETG